MPKKTYTARKVIGKRKKIFFYVLSSIAFTVVVFGLSNVSTVRAYYDYVLQSTSWIASVYWSGSRSIKYISVFQGDNPVLIHYTKKAGKVAYFSQTLLSGSRSGAVCIKRFDTYQDVLNAQAANAPDNKACGYIVNRNSYDCDYFIDMGTGGPAPQGDTFPPTAPYCGAPNGWHSTGIAVDDDDWICVYQEDNYCSGDGDGHTPNCKKSICPATFKKKYSAPYDNLGSEAVNANNTCGHLWYLNTVQIDISAYRATAASHIPISEWVVEQCWGDWPDEDGGCLNAACTQRDWDYNDYYFAWSYATHVNECSITVDKVTQSIGTNNGTVRVSLWGKSYGDPDAGNDINLWVTRTTEGNYASNAPIPTAAISPGVSTYTQPNNGRKFYKIDSAGCDVNGEGGTCSKTTDISLPAGDYLFHCDGYNSGAAETAIGLDASKCSGNPYCDYENIAGTEYPWCTDDGWTSCGANDNVRIEINLAKGVVPQPACINNATQIRATFSPVLNYNNVNMYRYRLDKNPSSWYNPGAGDQYIDKQRGSGADNPDTEAVFNISDPTATYRIMVNGQRRYENNMSNQPWAYSQTVTCVQPSCTLRMPVDITGKHQGDPDFLIGLSERADPGWPTPFVEFLDIPNNYTTRVRYESTGPVGIIDVIPPDYDDSNTYDTWLDVVGSVGTAKITGTCQVINETGTIVDSVSDTMNITVDDAPAWWQVVDADVWSSGVINSEVPDDLGEFFDIIVPAFNPFYVDPKYPGVPVGQSVPISSSLVSDAPFQWKANSWTVYRDNSLNKQFRYEYFWDNLPQEIRTGIESDGLIPDAIVPPAAHAFDFDWFNNNDGYFDGTYHFYKREGALKITGGDRLGKNDPGRKVVLFVDGKITYQNIPDGDTSSAGKLYWFPQWQFGDTFFMAISSGDMEMKSNPNGDDPTQEITVMDGIFVTDGTFYTGEGGLEGLVFNGSVIAWNGVELRKGLNNTYEEATETFFYRPQMILNIPPYFGLQTMKWTEVAP